MPQPLDERQALEAGAQRASGPERNRPARARGNDGSGPDTAGVPRVADQASAEPDRPDRNPAGGHQDRGSVTTRAQEEEAMTIGMTVRWWWTWLTGRTITRK